MTNPIVVVAVAYGVTAVLFFACAYAIGVRGILNLIAGYDPARVRDGAALGRWIGGGLFWLGCITLALALVQFFMPSRAVGAVFVAAVFIGTLILTIGARRYRV